MAAPSAPRLRAAVLGLGLAGRAFHVPHLAACADFELTVLCQRGALDPTLAGDLAALAPHARIVRSVEEAVSAPDVDVVVVATPDATHFSIAQAALRAGKHVLVDKPLTSTLAQAAALLAQAAAPAAGGGAASRLVCMPYQNRRHCGDFATVEAVLRAGRLGDLIEFESHYDRFRPEVRRTWKELDRGCLDNLGPHMIDQALLLFGEPARVWASVRALRDGATTDDAFELQLFYDVTGEAAGRPRIAGLVAPPRWRVVLKSTMLAAANDLKFVCHGTEGSFVKSGLDGQEAMLLAGGPVLPTAAGYGVEPAHFHGTLTSRSGTTETVPTLRASYATMYERLAAAIRSPAPLASQEVPPAVALLLMRVIDTARKSSATGATEPLVDAPCAASF